MKLIDWIVRFVFMMIVLIVEIDLMCCHSESEAIDRPMCEPIVGECRDIGYNFTTMSSPFFLMNVASASHFSTQQAADATIKSFEMLMPCSKYLKPFLCAAYKPSCHEDISLIVRPCRSMCEHVYERCFPLMDKFMRKWRPELNCSNFKEEKSQSCMHDRGYTKDLPRSSLEYMNQIDLLLERVGWSRKASTTTSASVRLKQILIEPFKFEKQENPSYYAHMSTSFKQAAAAATKSSVGWSKRSSSAVNSLEHTTKSNGVLAQLRNDFNRYICYRQQSDSLPGGNMMPVRREQTIYMNREKKSPSENMSFTYYSKNAPSSGGRVPITKCTLKCDSSVWFNPSEKQFAKVLMVTVCAVCLICSLLTMLIFRHTSSKLNLPGNCYLYLALCYAIYSLLHLSAILAGRERIACRQVNASKVNSFVVNEFPNKIRKSYSIMLDASSMSENNFCSITLLLAYYFRMSLLAWWFISIMSWLLGLHNFATAAEWSRIQFKQFKMTTNSYFHFIGWSLPTFQTIVILLMRSSAVDVAELTGLCSIGERDSNTLFKYVIVPTCIYVISGMLLVLAGFSKILVGRRQHRRGTKGRIGLGRVVVDRQNSNSYNNTNTTSTGSSIPATTQLINGYGNIKTYSEHDKCNCDTLLSSVNAASEDEEFLRREVNIKQGLFGLVLAIPWLVVLSCELYEYFNMNGWKKMPVTFDLSERVDESAPVTFDSLMLDKNPENYLNFVRLKNTYENLLQLAFPDAIIYIIKIFMQFLNGVLILFLVIIHMNINKSIRKRLSCCTPPISFVASSPNASRFEVVDNKFLFKSPLSQQQQQLNVLNMAAVAAATAGRKMGVYLCNETDFGLDKIDASLSCNEQLKYKSQCDCKALNAHAYASECLAQEVIKMNAAGGKNSLNLPLNSFVQQKHKKYYANVECLSGVNQNDLSSLVSTPLNGHHYCTPNFVNIVPHSHNISNMPNQPTLTLMNNQNMYIASSASGHRMQPNVSTFMVKQNLSRKSTNKSKRKTRKA
jgi:hypothetical protein